MATRVAGKFETTALATPANAITSLRVVATPVMVLIVVHDGVSWLSFAVWVALASTDSLDGWVARRQGATTSGAFLDPLADKFLVLGALFALAAGGLTGWWPVGLIALREVLISLYRSAVARQGISVPARPLGKAKTTAQDLAIGLLVLPGVGDRHGWIGRDLLWVAVVLAVASAVQYLRDGRRSSPVPPGGAVSPSGRVG